MSGCVDVKRFTMVVLDHMTQAVTIALIAAMVGIRLLLPPVPGLLKAGYQRWGMRNTILLGTICAALAIFVSKR